MIIIPRPQKMIVFDGIYNLGKGLVASEKNSEKVGKDALLLGIDIKVGNYGEENVFFYNDATLKEEEYEISVDVGGIKIISASAQGTFRALSTLKQILEQKEDNSIPFLKINDYPDIPVRGIMLMAHSSCIYKMETVEYIVDRLAELKYNMLQLYFDTFVFEYDSFRKQLEGKMYYTKEEIRHLDAYCKERHIELMANVETFGHMSELLACDEFAHLGITRDDGPKFSVNPILEESFEVVAKILDDLLPNFSSGTVNIGMDETYGLGEHETEEYCKTFGIDGAYLDFLEKVSCYVKEKHGKRSMFWGDMAAKYPERMSEISKDNIYVDWGYEPGHKFDRNAVACREAGLDFYVSPGTHQWGTITGRTDVMVQNIYFSAESGRHYGASGFLLTDWSINCTPSITLLSITYGGAFSWNSGNSYSFSESHNEMDCLFRTSVSDDVLWYYDKFIAKSTGKSCAEIVYRMGNYWFMEQPKTNATWNGTILVKNFMSGDDEYSILNNSQLKRIKNYMMEIRKELDECHFKAENGELIMKELTSACELVIFAADSLMKKNSAEYDENEIDAEKLIENYRSLSDAHFCVQNEIGTVRAIKKWKGIS